MMRHRFPLDLRGNCEASAPARERLVSGSSPLEPPTLHGDGHDHIVGGGGIPEALVPSPDSVIDLADGTRITFATVGVSPRL
jgi:hypothetical protein